MLVGKARHMHSDFNLQRPPIADTHIHDTTIQTQPPLTHETYQHPP
jgi:hypothetical protein